MKVGGKVSCDVSIKRGIVKLFDYREIDFYSIYTDNDNVSSLAISAKRQRALSLKHQYRRAERHHQKYDRSEHKHRKADDDDIDECLNDAMDNP
jgi:hypothetical protein